MCSQKKQQAMASDNVSGGLVTARTKLWADFEQPERASDLSQPECLLWLAVIDRAIADYVKRPPDLSSKYTQGLEWFFFELKPAPYNLQYICDQLFDDSSTAQVIRKRIKTLSTDDGEQIKVYLSKRYTLRINSKYY